MIIKGRKMKTGTFWLYHLGWPPHRFSQPVKSKFQLFILLDGEGKYKGGVTCPRNLHNSGQGFSNGPVDQ